MKKKVVSALLAAMMVVSLAACGSTGTTADTTDDSAANTEAAPGTEAADDAADDVKSELTAEIDDIVIDVSTGLELSDLDAVEAAMNEITESEIGVHVVLNPVFLFDMDSTNMMAVSSGEQLDLMMTFSFTGGTGSYISSGACLPLDDYIDTYGAYLEDFLGSAINAGYSSGSLYSIPAASKHGGGYAFYARKDILDDCGIEVDADKVYTMDDLAAIFAAVKEKNPDMYMIAGYHSNMNVFEYFQPYDTLGGSEDNGVLMNLGLDGNTEVVDVFETEEYAQYAQTMYDWAQAGYIPADASTNEDDGTVQIAAGNYLGTFNMDGCLGDYEQSSSYELVELTTMAPVQSSQKISTTFWMVSSTCEHPEKAVALLNLMFENPALGNLFSYGIEDLDYVMVEEGTEEGQGIIAFPDGMDSTSVGYYLGDGAYSDSMHTYMMAPETLDYYANLEAFNAQFTAETSSIALGYGFDSSAVSSQISAVDSVIAEYKGVISAGESDPETTLANFISALKDAGMDDIVAANNEQFQAWLAEQ